MGKMFYKSIDFGLKNSSISLLNMPNGIYFINIKKDGKILATEKIIKQ